MSSRREKTIKEEDLNGTIRLRGEKVFRLVDVIDPVVNPNNAGPRQSA